MITHRLQIDPLGANDHVFILELLNTEGWLKFIGDRYVRTVQDAQQYVQRTLENHSLKYWIVKTRTDQQPVGLITFIKRGYLDHHDIGFAFLPRAAGKGYAYEAAERVLHEYIRLSEHPKILASVLPHNHSSVKLLQKLGMEFSRGITVENEELLLYETSADLVNISQVVKVFFSAFNNKTNAVAPLDLLRQVCIPAVRIIQHNNGAAQVYDLENFIEPRKKILSDGTLTRFEEKETYAQTHVLNNIAHRYLVYEKTGVLEGKAFHQKGHKFLHFVLVEGEWRISSVLWEDEEKTPT